MLFVFIVAALLHSVCETEGSREHSRERSREGENGGSDSQFLSQATATIDVKLIAGAAFTVTVEGKDALGHTKMCHNVAVGSDCKIHNVRLNSNISVTYHCIPNTHIAYSPVIPGEHVLKTWGTCWVPEYESEPDGAVVDVTRVSSRRLRKI